MELIKYPNEILNTICDDITKEEMNDDLIDIMDNMLDLMIKEKGIGLAAPQIGITKKYCIVHIPSLKTPPIYMINPSILKNTKQTIKVTEGCLSVIDEECERTRYEGVTIECLDKEFKKQTLHLSGMFAICAQHEIDHLNGITIKDEQRL